ncbi:MAG: hypothetical protein KME17_23900 [Cyanosarcina radialis HA8281-LM2]|jgi:chromosome segregation ATPase|nr:hypothetical protein [Cyanosarcina radialis HA8281-LM2]
MTSITENDLKRLEDIIATRFDELGRGQTEIKERITAIENGQKNLETGQKNLEIAQTEIKWQIAVIDSRLKTLETSFQKIPDLAEKVGELKNWKQIALTLGGALIGGIITYLVKNPNNP